jgi:hypothetical protein
MPFANFPPHEIQPAFLTCIYHELTKGTVGIEIRKDIISGGRKTVPTLFLGFYVPKVAE